MKAAAPLVPVLVVCLAGGALAAPDDVDPNGPPASAARSAGAGAFLPFSMSARSDSQRTLVHAQGGYDQARQGAVLQSLVETRVLERLSLRAGATYLGPAGTVRPDLGFKVDLLRQEAQGMDLAVAGGYEAQGFNLTPAMAARIAGGRVVGETTLLGNLGYGHGLEAGERYGDARLAAVRRAGGGLHLGLDSRFRADLERDSDEPAGEPDWELTAGPFAAYSLGRFLLSASAGVSAIKFRLSSEPTRVGATGALGLGAVF